MCVSKVYIIENGKEMLIMEEIENIEINGDEIIFTDLFGEKKKIEAKIKKIDFENHKVFLTK